MLNFKTFLIHKDIHLGDFKTAVKANKNQPCLAKDDNSTWVIAGVDWVEAEAGGFGTFDMWNELDEDWKTLCEDAKIAGEEIVFGFDEIF